MRKAAGILSLVLLSVGLAWAQSIPPDLAEAARKARAERAKMAGKVPMFTNDNLPKSGGLSVAGSVAAATARPGGEAAAEGEGGAAAEPGDKEKKCDEACWKGKFAEKRKQIKDAEAEVDVLQREYNLARTQYYQDPNAAMREQYSNNTAGGRQLQDLNNKIAGKKADIDRMKQELSALEDDLRKSGGQPGWARP